MPEKRWRGSIPCMIVELSATPPREANVLIDIRGIELNAEEMIKLDLNIRNLASASWKDTLLASIEHRKLLEAGGAKARSQYRRLYPSDLRDSGGAHRQRPTQAGSGARRRCSRIPAAASGHQRGADRHQGPASATN